jgi:acyl-CoA thioesterase-1
MRSTTALPRTASRFAAGKPVRILAIGSSSTLGTGASSPAAAYPAQLEIALESKFPSSDVTIVNAGIAGETAERTLARMDRELERTKPDLVLWQVGTADALIPSVSEQDFEATVERGIASIRQHESDLLLIDPQFFKTANDVARYERFVATIERVARKEGVCLFSRYRLMKAWDAAQNGGVELMLASDRFHMNDVGYSCIAQSLARQIEDAVARASDRG